MALSPELSPAEKTQYVHEELTRFFGLLALKPRRLPMHELISTMLSHRTNHAMETLAYTQMLVKFGTWPEVLAAPFEALADTLAPAQFPGAKAANIQKALQQIKQKCGELKIDFLQDLPEAEGLAWLTSLPGVGLKTASLLLLFNFGKKVIPVDTHVHRVTQRIGIIGLKDTAEKAHTLLPGMLPPHATDLFNFHIHLLWHGQRICTFRAPKCLQCPVREVCNYFHQQVAPRLKMAKEANTPARPALI